MIRHQLTPFGVYPMTPYSVGENGGFDSGSKEGMRMVANPDVMQHPHYQSAFAAATSNSAHPSLLHPHGSGGRTIVGGGVSDGDVDEPVVVRASKSRGRKKNINAELMAEAEADGSGDAPDADDVLTRRGGKKSQKRVRKPTVSGTCDTRVQSRLLVAPCGSRCCALRL
jgi:hypothetical protein